MRSQLDKTNNELHASLREKLQLEKWVVLFFFMLLQAILYREQHVKEQEYLKQAKLLERDIASSQEKLQEMVDKLHTMEVKLTSSENEVSW